jgi:hypothetical protein
MTYAKLHGILAEAAADPAKQMEAAGVLIDHGPELLMLWSACLAWVADPVEPRTIKAIMVALQRLERVEP